MKAFHQTPCVQLRRIRSQPDTVAAIAKDGILMGNLTSPSPFPTKTKIKNLKK